MASLGHSEEVPARIALVLHVSTVSIVGLPHQAKFFARLSQMERFEHAKVLKLIIKE